MTPTMPIPHRLQNAYRRTFMSRAKTWLRACLLAAGVLAAAAPAHSQTPVEPFFMVADVEPTSRVFKWASLIYNEAFKRLGIPVQVSTLALARRSALANEGAIDGEVSRIYAYADSNPHLIRIEEPVMPFTFALFTANPAVGVARLEDLASNNLLVEHRRGILMCENTLKKFVPAERLSNVTTTEQGIKKLLAGRTDLYCDIDMYVLQTLQTSDFEGITTVRKAFKVASLPTYPYIHKKHAALAPRLTAVLKQMRAEGLLDAYQQQIEREAGAAR